MGFCLRTSGRARKEAGRLSGPALTAALLWSRPPLLVHSGDLGTIHAAYRHSREVSLGALVAIEAAQMAVAQWRDPVRDNFPWVQPFVVVEGQNAKVYVVGALGRG